MFEYLPLTNCVKDMYCKRSLSQKMSYRSSFTYSLTTFEDVFSGSHYQGLLLEQVIIDGVACSHRYFSDPRDVALGLLTDSFQVFCQVCGRSATCWLIITINFNLPPSECIHMDNIIPIAIIPGPKAPKDINSFFCPLINECKLLTKGIHMYDVAHNESFDLHIYPISIHGDMQAIKHCTNLKGSNAFHLCHACLIQAVQDESKPHSTYYVPLHQPKQPRVEDSEWGPETLPYHTQTQSKHNKVLQDILQRDTK